MMAFSAAHWAAHALSLTTTLTKSTFTSSTFAYVKQLESVCVH